MSQYVVSLNPIDAHYLKAHFKNCLQKDSFDGVAFLTNYCQKNGVSVSSYDIGQFKQLLDYYLNSEFNLSKVMAFVKFYTYFYSCRQALVLGNKDAQNMSD
jgi:hypothetical protein